jgi:hypothetical protein
MVEQVELEPTMEEIVVALRETRRGIDRPSPFTLVGGHARGSGASDKASGVGKRDTTAAFPNEFASTGIADLRDQEIERLLTENARLNERIMFLLKIIEREQARNALPAAILEDRSMIFQDVKAALEAEIRPVLLVLLRLLEKQRIDPAYDVVRVAAPGRPNIGAEGSARGDRHPAAESRAAHDPYAVSLLG